MFVVFDLINCIIVFDIGGGDNDFVVWVVVVFVV